MCDKENWIEQYELSKTKKSCCNCKFYSPNEYVCDRNYNATCILNEDKTGQNCKYFKFGEYNENDLEDKEIIGFVQY
jgi:hypothetical protein